MAKHPPLSFSDVETICRHNAYLIEACELALATYRVIPKRDRSDMINANITYYKNAKSALEWSSGQAKQRLKGSQNVA